MNLLHGDCMELLPEIPDKSVGLILTDLPYGTTECKWDKVLPMADLWKEYRRVLRPNGVAALFAAQPFTTELINSNRAAFRYCWYWVKNIATGFAFARYQPRRKVEEIVIFVCNVPGKNNAGQHKALRAYMQSELKASGHNRASIGKVLGNTMASHYFTNGSQFSIPPREQWEKLQRATGHFARSWDDVREEYQIELGQTGGGAQIYNPQGLQIIQNPKIKRRKAIKADSIYEMGTLAKEHTPKYTGYPANVLQFNTERGYHPTQKPVPLLEYLIRTYTHEGDTVLDSCMGSGSTGVACVNTGRRFIGIEKDPHYFGVAKERIQAQQTAQSGHDNPQNVQPGQKPAARPVAGGEM